MKTFLLSFILLFAINIQLYAQDGQNAGLAPEELDRYKKQVEELVSYFEGTLNFIGDPDHVSKEKEIIINDSYLKIFKDDKVQVEDDLDESREVPIHKDVQAYLKDIEFFFKSVSFQFVVSEVTFNTNDDNLNYFKVTLNRDLHGITIEGDTVSNKKVRFMEINLDIANNDLRIASLYTTKLNEREEIRNWWNDLTPVWREFFGKNLVVYDSLRLSSVQFIADSLILISDSTKIVQVQDSTSGYDIEVPPERVSASAMQDLDSLFVNTQAIYNMLSGIVQLKKVDISDMEDVRDLSPLAELSELTDLNCANTLIVNLVPLRNLNKLEFLDLTNTPVDDISPLQYSTSLRDLNCSFTLIDDLSSISGLYRLERLNCSGLRIYEPDFASELINMHELNLSETNINDLSFIEALINLDELNVSETRITNLDVVSSFSQLRYLNAESTSITNIDPLKGLKNLELLKISYTAVENLQALDSLHLLTRIYWDSNMEFSIDTDSKRTEAIRFMNDHPGSLVIFESEELMNGWADLEEPWKKLARSLASLSENPTKEELHFLLQVEEVRIDTSEITTLKPVASLYNLKKLIIPGLQVEDYEAIGEAHELEYLDLSLTTVRSIDFASTLKNLKELNIRGTAVKDISALEGLDELQIIYADNSGITEEMALDFRTKNPDCVILFKTADLKEWWESMPDGWKNYFTTNFQLDNPPSKEKLHQLYYLEELEVSEIGDITSLQPLGKLTNLKVLKCSKLNVGDLQSIVPLTQLKELHCFSMPVNDLTPLSSMKNLEVMILENTSVADLKPIATLVQLKKLNISGTQVKSLKPLSDLSKIETVELNNTQVKSISSLFSLPAIQSLSCFNTKVSAKNIEKFKAEKPECKVVYY